MTFPSLAAGGGMHAWAIATAATVAAACAVVGTLLVVRRLSLLGDCISHAVLPGVAVAVLAGGKPGGLLVLGGAVGAALATVWLAERIRCAGGLGEDAAAGVAFTTLFALGVLLITAFVSTVDLDPGCMLHGVLEMVPFDTVPLAGAEVPRAFLTATWVLAAVVAGVVMSWKLQLFAAFDPAAARAAGVPVGAVTTALLAATALVTVAGFEAVGPILVVAMLVVPAATAELLSRRLHRIAVLAVVLAVAAAVIGYILAWKWSTNAAGMIAVVLGLEYAAVVLVAPDGGLLARALGRAAFRSRVVLEDRLAAWWRAEEAKAGATPAAIAPPVATPRRLVERLADVGLWCAGRLEKRPQGWKLTDRGRREADMVVRSHRLWEAWLGRHARIPLDHLHPPAEWIEHHLGTDLRRRIEAEVGPWTIDPHGRAIPPEPGTGR